MLKHLFVFVFIILMLQSSSYASDDYDEEELDAEGPEVIDSFQRTYGIVPYPWQLRNFPSYLPRNRIPQNADDDEEPAPNVDPRFVTNRCHPGHSFTTTNYPCTTFTSTLSTIITTVLTTITSTVTTIPTSTPTITAAIILDQSTIPTTPPSDFSLATTFPDDTI